MKNFKKQLLETLEKISALSDISEKVASEKACAEAQQTCATASSCLYDVLSKTAEITEPELPTEKGLPTLIAKLGSANTEQHTKLAAAILVDQLIDSQEALRELSPTDKVKLAQLRSYGREFAIRLIKDSLA